MFPGWVSNEAAPGKKPSGGSSLVSSASTGLVRASTGEAKDEAVYCIRGVPAP